MGILVSAERHREKCRDLDVIASGVEILQGF